jgi:hypothetical protein
VLDSRQKFAGRPDLRGARELDFHSSSTRKNKSLANSDTAR